MANKQPSRSPRRKAPSNAARPRKPAPKQKTRRVRPRLINEFKPDAQKIDLANLLYLTEVQRNRFLRWALYITVCVVCLVIQDCIMSKIHIFHATTDLCVAAMLLIAVIEGSEVGGVFILVASCVYYFSGSAPGPYSVGLLSALGLAASLFRQQVWHRSFGSILLCSGLAAMLYELGLYAVGLFLGLTSWYRLPRFFFTGLLTVAAMIPLNHLIHRIGQIGGNTWKE